MFIKTYLGFLVFGIVNYLAFGIAFAIFGHAQLFHERIAAAALLAGMVLSLCALAYFRLRWRSAAAGLLVGYVVMTILSQGSCTLMFYRPLFEGSSPEWAEAGGAFYYVLLLAVAGPISLLATLVATSLDRR